MLDHVIRGGRIVDGTGGPPFVGDVAISGDRIIAVGNVAAESAQTTDARGLLVTPGFVDIHTHYDGQASWDALLMPSSLHGVTSVAFGNCGVGFAPARADRHAWLIDLLEGVEDIPGTALAEGLTWDWETFPEYLDALDRRRFVLDVGAHMPHAPLRAYVMGEPGGDPSAVPTAAEMRTMAQLVVEAIDAGALGFSTSRTMVHRTKAGETIATYRAPDEELLAIARAIGKCGRGVIQLISDAYLLADEAFADDEFNLIEKMADLSGRPLSLTVQQVGHLPDRWRWMFERVAALRQRGHDVRAQVAARAIGAIVGLRTSSNPFAFTPTWATLADLSFEERLTRVRQPAIRQRLLSEVREPSCHPLAAVMADSFGRLFRMADPVDYEPAPDRSLGAEAIRLGRDPAAHTLEVMLEEEGSRLLYMPSLNYAHGSLDDVHEMMSADFALFGLSDGGAHCGAICDASFPTTAISLWPQGIRSGRSIPLETAVNGYTQRNARQMGWNDRGVLMPGYLADLNLIDEHDLALPPPDAVHDLPAGGMRLVQRARGYRMTIKRGEVTFLDGVPTEARPGRLMRGPAEPAPV